MNAAIGLAGELFGVASAAALVVALLASSLGRRTGTPNGIRQIAVVWSVAVSFVAGYALLPRDFAGFAPDPMQPWKWLPYAALWASLVSTGLTLLPTSIAGKLSIVVKATVPAYVFTPGWPVWGLEPKTLPWLTFAYLLVVGLTLEPLGKRTPCTWFLCAMTVAALVTALVIAGLVSLRLAQLATIAAAAFLGATLTTVWNAKANKSNGDSVVVSYMLLVGGIAWIACVEPEPPQRVLLLLPLIPAALWLIVGVQRFRPRAS